MTKRLGVMGDSHCQTADELDASIVEALDGCEHIVHLGDVSSVEVLDRIETIAPITGVSSTTDPVDQRLLGTATELDFAGLKVAVRRSLDTAESFPDEVRVVLHGGTHDHAVSVRKGRLFVNPGATRWATRNPTLARLTFEDDGAIGVEIVAVTDA